MKLINHLGEIFELQIEKYHFESSKDKLFDSDWLNVSIGIKTKENTFFKYLDFFLIEDLERINDWLTGVRNKKSNKKLYFLDVPLVFMRIARNNVPFIKVIYYLTERDFISWDLEINKENVLEFKNKLKQNLKIYPCRCGMVHDYDKV